MKIERGQVIASRLWRQGLARRGDLLGAARTAPQNTPPGSAQLALRARADVTAEQVAQALDVDRSLIQVWSLRGSPCVFPVEDLPLFTTGLLPDDEESWRAQMAGFLPMLDEMGRTAGDTMRLVIDATRDALNGAILSKRELGAALQHRLPKEFAPWMEPDTFSSFTAILTRAASLTGEFALAPRAGNEASFLRVDQWLDAVPQAAADPRAGLLRRYLRLYGPSSVTDFAAWAGVDPAYAGRSWRLVEPELSEVTYGGQTLYALTEDLAALESPANVQGVRLLPPYDPYLQQRDRATLAPNPALHKRIWKKTGNPGAILVGGELAALWRHRKQAKTLHITIEPLKPIDLEAIEAEAAPYAAFRNCQKVEIATAP